MELRYNRTYYYNLMTKDKQEEWMVEFLKSKSKSSLEEFLSHPLYDFREFITSSFPWKETKRGYTWWLNYANTDESILLSLNREDKLSELGI